MSQLVMRDYQRDGLDAVHTALAGTARSTLLVLPTGMGKSLTFSKFIQDLRLQDTEVALVIAHRDELLEQANTAIVPGLDGAWIDREVGSARAASVSKVIISSVQTLKGKRLDEFFHRFEGRIRALIIDEAHRAAAPTYLKIIEKVLGQRDDSVILGVTATPRRTDKVGLGVAFESIAYSMTMKDGIERGFLVPLRGYRVETSTSIENVGTNNGDFVIGELTEAIDQASRNDLIVATYKRLVPGRKTIVFAASVEHARHIADTFNSHGIPSEAASGDMDKKKVRPQIIERFRSGQTLVLVNCSLYVEGFDVPDTEGVIHASPTKSNVVYQQRTGRVTRPHPSVARMLGELPSDSDRRMIIAASPKPYAFVIDICDVTRRHSLESLPSLFGLPPKLDIKGRSVSEVSAKYEKIVEADPLAVQRTFSLAQIDSRISEIDVFAVPEVSFDVAGTSDYTWYQAAPGVYRLTFPPMAYASTYDGRKIADFDRVLEEQIRKLGPEARGNERFIAEEQLGIRPRSRTILNIAMEVRQTAAEMFTVVRVENRVDRVIGSRTSLREAFAGADDYIAKHYAWALGVVRRDTSDRNEPITPRQTRLLRSLGVAERDIPQTKAQAMPLIDKLLAAQKDERVSA